MSGKGVVPYEGIQERILFIRGQRVLLDAELAALYGVTTKRLNEQVKRNRERFPEDFMFQLTLQEAAPMRSQFATASKRNVGHRPYAFTEHGAIMAASVLNSPRAIEASVWVVRAFVKFREVLATHRVLFKRLSELEARVGGHDEELRAIITALKALMQDPAKKKKPIGFGVKETKGKYRRDYPLVQAKGGDDGGKKGRLSQRRKGRKGVI